MISFSIPTLAARILSTLSGAGFQVYVVGGGVRDLFQKKPVYDWDFTTNAVPEQILRLFRKSFYDNRFGTVMVAGKHLALQFGLPLAKWSESIFDITTFRTDHGYTDRRRPDKVSWGESIETDLSRRDFTINAMALKPLRREELSRMIKKQILMPETELKFELIDPFSGQVDLAKKRVRAVGNPEQRFNEDALRMMRAIRIGAQLAFTIEEKTLAAIQNSAPLLKHVSFERIRDELTKIIASEYPADGILLLHASGLLDYILPELTATINVPQAGHHIYDVWRHSVESLRHCPASDPLVRLAALLHDIGKAAAFRRTDGKITFYNHEVIGANLSLEIADRLRLSRKEKRKLYILVRWHMFSYDPKMSDAAIRRFIRRVGKEYINEMMLLRIGDRKGGGSKTTSWRLRELEERIGQQLYEPMSLSDLKIDGNEIMELLQIEPGPRVGKILNSLFEEIMEDSGKNNKEYLVKRVKELNEAIV